ncbi:MAG: 5'/3'-nucleotidase SurE [Phycisphaerae bacterium]|nr:5'/3'-nucleotidase SurE [Phycisphaerae bacterium]
MLRVLLCNDDGIDAPGLATLIAVVRELGHAPIVVAPRTQMSMCGHAISGRDAVSVELHATTDGVPRYAVDGTPADCVRVALRHLPIGPVDRVIAGINRGANAGVDVYYSGTAAAAREAAILGVPAIAVSQLIRADFDDDWTPPGRNAALALREILPERARPRGTTFVNVNLPEFRDGCAPRGLRWCDLTPAPLLIEYQDRAGAVRNTGSYFARPAPAGYDFALLLEGWITLTRVAIF